MKKKWIYSMAALALVLGSCSDSDELTGNPPDSGGPLAVGFEATSASSAVGTRATVTQASTLENTGFGVFAYEQEGVTIADQLQTSAVPNFMFNQKVTGSSSCQYSPIKYWPNNEDAKLSFYGYAPYSSTLSTEKVNDEGMRLLLENQYGGPAIQYTLPKDLTKTVDLCYAENSSANSLRDLSKPSVDSKTHFQFKHAMAQLNFDLQVWNDLVGNSTHSTGDETNSGTLADGTKITLKKLEIIGEFPSKGVLQLSDGNWITTGAKSNLTFTSGWNSTFADGITGDEASEEKNLFYDADGEFMTVIPATSTQKIHIVYDVETTDANLLAGKSSVTNDCYADYTTGIEAGKAYTFHLNIGMTSVKVTADVANWDDAASNTQDIDMPANSESGVSISAATVSIEGTGTTTLTVEKDSSKSSTTIQAVTWTTSAETVATVAADVSDKKKATVTGVAAGTAIITATVTLSDGSTVTKTCEVTVTTAP